MHCVILCCFDFSLRIIRIKYCEVNSRSGESVCMSLSSLIRVRTLQCIMADTFTSTYIYSLVLVYLSTCQKHKRCLMSPYTAFVADHPVLSTLYIIIWVHTPPTHNNCNYVYECVCMFIPSSVITTLTVVVGDLVLILLRNISMNSLASLSAMHHPTGCPKN